MTRSHKEFSPAAHEEALSALIEELVATESLSGAELDRILRRYPKDGRGLYSRAEILRGVRFLNRRRDWKLDESVLRAALQLKPIRTLSGVAPVTVLSKPYPCPGRCIFCPSDVRMPKSYLSSEPGAQRAAHHQFDPYDQTLSRLQAYHNIGHPIDKVELIILGGTWSFYPETYQIYFVKRCFEALNDARRVKAGRPPSWSQPTIDFRQLEETIDGRALERTYNRVVSDFAAEFEREETEETATWKELEAVQSENEGAAARCVGLVLETRPDHLSGEEVLRLRRLGATKVQIGLQSLSDEVLKMNHRGHDVSESRRAMKSLRLMGFKIHAHWMPNLHGSTLTADREDFSRLFDEPDFRPDELKIYPCSLIESAELMANYERGEWRPYGRQELIDLLADCFGEIPEYCRVTRVVRDIPGTDIVDGNRTTNLRQLVEEEMARRGQRSRDIRAREVRSLSVAEDKLSLREEEYATSTGKEVFLQFVTDEDRLAAFLRLSLPTATPLNEELAGSAVIREVHVYGRLMGFGERSRGRSQHLGLGAALIERAEEVAAAGGHRNLAVISAVGTRRYYRRLGFVDGELYQHRPLGKERNTSQESAR